MVAACQQTMRMIMADDEGIIQEVVSRMKEKAGNLAYTFPESRQRFKILATAQHRHCTLTTKSSTHCYLSVICTGYRR